MKVYYTTAPVTSEAFMNRVFLLEGIRDGIVRTQSGKPHFCEDGAPKFNLTHTEGLTALAVGGQEVGVDAECRTRRIPEAILRRLTPREREADFFTLWTAKEAYIKLRGGTLADMLPSLCFENGVLYENGEPVPAVFKHIFIADHVLCVCTEAAEDIELIGL